MRHTATTVLAAILTAVFACASLHAAAIRFIPLNDGIAASQLGVRDAKGTTVLKGLNPHKRSIPYTCTIGKKPLLLVALDRKDADGKPATVEIVLPLDMKSPLVLILADPQHLSGLRAITIDDSNASFPWGSLRFFKSTASALMVRYGTEEKPLAEGDALVGITPGGDARNVGVQLFNAENPKDILYSAVWEHDPNVRKLVFIVPGVDPKTRAFDLKIIPEVRPLKK